MKQVRNTPAKQFISGLIADSGRALSYAEIQEGSAGKCDRVTIYRVLERLENEGHIHRVAHSDGVVRYAVCSTCAHGSEHHHHHVHFLCRVCGEVTCLEGVIPEFKLPRKYVAEEMNFSVSGRCPKCSE